MTGQATRVRIIEVEPLDGYLLRVRFSDGSSREVDLASELWAPVFEPLRDLELFRKGGARDHRVADRRRSGSRRAAP